MNAKLVRAITAIDNIKSAMNRMNDDDIETLVKLGYGYTHIIGAAISCTTTISDTDLLKIAKCIIGNVNYRNHVPADDNNSLIDTIDSIADKYIDR